MSITVLDSDGHKKTKSVLNIRSEYIISFFLFSFIVFLALYRLDIYPSTSFDEGVHLLAAKKLALEGKYRFGPALGPTVFFPVAVALRLAGVELLPARLVMAGYLLLCVLAFYVLVRYLSGWKVASVGLLLLVSSPGVNLLFWGRQVLGEVPALFFCLLGILIWFKALEEKRQNPRREKLLLGGLVLGLAILTKNQLILLLPAFFLLWLADRLYYHQLNHLDFGLPIASAMVSVTAWYVGLRLFSSVGNQLTTDNIEQWSNALNRGILVFSLERAQDALKFLTSQDTFYAWVLPGVVYAIILSLHRSKEGLRWALLLVITMIWFGWFTLFSVGWPRYAFLALALVSIFISRLFYDLTDSYSLPVQALLAKIRAEQWDAMLVGKFALLTLLLVIVLRPLQARFTEVVTYTDNSSQQISTYIVNHLPEGAEIETYEPEICFLTGYDCHLPPSQIMDLSIRYVWYHASPPSDYYNFKEHGSPYLLIGNFGRWVHLYDQQIIKQNYILLVSIGGYELYQIKQVSTYWPIYHIFLPIS